MENKKQETRNKKQEARNKKYKARKTKRDIYNLYLVWRDICLAFVIYRNWAFYFLSLLDNGFQP